MQPRVKFFRTFASIAVLTASFASPSGFVQAQESAATDTQIQAQIVAKLKADGDLSKVPVGITTQNGEVTITGQVPDAATQDKLEQAISQVSGITHISDNTTVGSSDAQTAAPNGATNEAVTAAQQAAQNPPAEATNAQDSQNGQQQDQQQQGMQQGQQQGMQQDQQQDQQQGPPQGNRQQYPQQYPQQGQQGPYGPPQRPYGYPQGQYPQGQYSQQPGPRPGPRTAPRSAYAAGQQLALPVGTTIYIRTLEPLDPAKVPTGTAFKGVVATDVFVDRMIAVPRGAAVTGVVSNAKAPGHYKGGAELSLQLTGLTLGSQTYQIASETWSQQGPGKGGLTAGNTVGGAAFGALIGAVAGGGPGAAIGAGAGAIAGGASTGLYPNGHLYVPAEAVLTFRLQQPITVTTVSYDDAQSLASALPPQPAYRRPPPRAYGPYGPYGPYGYGYRPYYGYPY